MTQLIHILKKDMRKYAWALISLAVLAAIEVYLQGTSLGLADNPLNRFLTLLTSIMGALLFFFVIVMVVQEEALADPQAYWLGRPIARGMLLAEKWVFLGILIGLYIVSEAVTLVLNGGMGRVGYVVLGVIPAMATWQPQLFLAAQTSSVPRYLVLAGALLVGFYGLLFLLFFVLEPMWISRLRFGALPADLPEHLSALIQSVYWFVVGFGVLAFLYIRRRILQAWLWLPGAVILAAVLTPADSFYGISSSVDEDHAKLEVDHIRTKGTIQQQGGEFIVCELVFAPLDEGVDEDIWVSIRNASITSEGKRIEVEAHEMNHRLRRPDGAMPYVPLGFVRKSDLIQAGDQVDIRAMAHLSFSRQHAIASMDLREGAGYSGNGYRFLIRSIYRAENKITVRLAGVVPELHFEPNRINNNQEAFDGRFAFALSSAVDDKPTLDFSIARSWNAASGGVETARLEAPLLLDEDAAKFRVVLFERKVTGQDWQFLRKTDGQLRREYF